MPKKKTLDLRVPPRVLEMTFGGSSTTSSKVVPLPKWRTREFKLKRGDRITIRASDKKTLERYLIIDLGEKK